MVSHGEIYFFNIDIKRSGFNLYDTNYEQTVYNGNLYDEIYVNVYGKLIHSIIDLRSEKLIESNVLTDPSVSRDILIVIDEADSYVKLLKSTKEESEKMLELIQKLLYC